MIGLAAVWGLCEPTGATVANNTATGREFHFRAVPGHRWRMERPAAERFAPAFESWRRAESASGARHALFGERIALGLRPGATLPTSFLQQSQLRPARQVGGRVWILDARDVWSAAKGAEALGRLPEVDWAMPVLRRTLALHGRFAPRSDDPYFTDEWHLENRDAEGRPLGPDTNPRAAWEITRGSGITMAICDDGFETDHPDLTTAAAGAPHYDFVTGSDRPGVFGPHATAVAGLAGATGDNHTGIAGVAPSVTLASWAIFDRFGAITSDERLMDMFRYRMQTVAVQNHSWGNGDLTLNGPSPMEIPAIAEAIEKGRGGLGVVMIRSGGNDRGGYVNANDDGYANDPRAIAVGAIRRDGHVASYGNPGACLLLAAPSGDSDDRSSPSVGLFTTDRVGSSGYNQDSYTNDLADYGFQRHGFSGTSASAPQVAGIAALILAANPGLGYRDVQQVLLNSAREVDPGDPDIRTNGAGYLVSHNEGFGVPNAGEAVRLAQVWTPRPPVVLASWKQTNSLAIPDDGLRVWVRESGSSERAIRCRPGQGPHADAPTAQLPLVFIGLATNEVSVDLRGKAALVERGVSLFREKIATAARAGAAFVVIYNNLDGDGLITPAETDFVPVPAVLISENDGQQLVGELAAGIPVEARIRLDHVEHAFVVTNPMICEHVGLRVRAQSGARGDLRITLVSPAGSRSVLQAYNQDLEPGPDDWTYWSVQHFYEPSAGTWTASFSDESPDRASVIIESELLIRGVPILDTDGDGLKDVWETVAFGDLRWSAADDPDHDGMSNAREQALGTDPTKTEEDLRLEISGYDSHRLRVSWRTQPLAEYRVMSTDSAGGPPQPIAVIAGQPPEAEWLVPVEPVVGRFFSVEAQPR